MLCVALKARNKFLSRFLILKYWRHYFCWCIYDECSLVPEYIFFTTFRPQRVACTFLNFFSLTRLLKLCYTLSYICVNKIFMFGFVQAWCVYKKNNFHLENVVALNFEKLFFFSTTHFLQFLGTFFSFKQECISLIENQIKIICKSNNVRATHYGNSFWVPLKVSRITAIKVYASVLYRITIFFGGYV